MSPFATYEDWDDCISQNQDKSNPEAYCGYIKHKVEDNPKKKDLISPEILVSKIRKIQENQPYLEFRDILKKAFSSQEDFIEDTFSLGEILESVASTYTKVKLDFAEDAAEPDQTQRLFETLRTYQEELGKHETSIAVPFSIVNTETGAIVKGNVIEQLDKNIKQLTPVSSSNVRAVGQYGTELLAQFHPSKLQPMRTYRFKFETPEMAEEAYRSLTITGSPGRWIWQNIRGHVKGEPIPASKIAPSLSPPGKGLPTIGGTTASLVDYSVSNRVPITRVKGFEQLVKQLKRETPNPIFDPSTGSRVEGLLETRKELRELGVKKKKLPISDMTYLGEFSELFTFDANAKDKDGLERCIEWMEKKGKTDNPEGTCYGILKGYAKMGAERAERKKKREEELKTAETHIKKRRFQRSTLEHLKHDVEWYKTLIKDADEMVERGNALIKEAEKRYPLAQTQSGKLHWAEEKKYARDSIRSALERKKGYQIDLKKAKQALKERKKEEKELYFSRAELHQHLRDLKKDDPYLEFPKRFHKNLKFAKNVKLSNWAESHNIVKWNEALNFLPTPFQNAAEIRIYNEISDDPDFLEDPDEPPKSYKEVGWDRKNRDVNGEIEYKHRRIRAKASDYDARGTVWHEIGHAVWQYGEWRFHEKEKFLDLWRDLKSKLAVGDKGEQYQANSVSELWAVQFEHYFRARWEKKEYGKAYAKVIPEVEKWFDANLRRYTYDENFIRRDLIEAIENFL